MRKSRIGRHADVGALWLAVALLAACEQQSIELASPTPSSSSCGAGASLVGADEPADDALALAGTDVTFSKDVLPILASTADGKVYKCTTCHPHYSDPEKLKRGSEMDRVIASVERGSMPTGGGTKMSASDIAVLKAWKNNGYKLSSGSTSSSSLDRDDDETAGAKAKAKSSATATETSSAKKNASATKGAVSKDASSSSSKGCRS